jgi:hypothetical protein
MTYLYNILLWLTWRLRLFLSPLLRSNLFGVPTYHTGGDKLLESLKWGGGLWWGDRHDGGYQVYSTPENLPMLSCSPRNPPYGGYYYKSDNVYSKFTLQIPFKAEVNVSYVGRLHPDSWDAPLWFYADDPNEIDVCEVYGDKFSPNIHWGESKQWKHQMKPMRYKMPGGGRYSFGVDAGYDRMKFYCNDVLVAVYPTPSEHLSSKFRAVIGVGSKTIHPIEPRNTMIINDIMISQ